MSSLEQGNETNPWSELLFRNETGVYIVFLVLVGIGILASPDFFSMGNLKNVVNSVALLGIVSVGVAFVTYSGNMADLSVPAIMALSGIVTVECLSFGLVPALCAGILSGILVGVINGFVVGHFDANGILWTLAMAFALKGFLRYINSNNLVYPDETPGTPGAAFIHLYRMEVGPVPITIILMVLFFIVGHVVMKHTRFGLQSKYTGSGRSAARHSGMSVRWTTVGAFVASAFASAVGGILLSSMNKLGVYHLGTGYDFQTVTAIVLGGITLAGGTGSMVGLFGGVMVIGLLKNIMTFLGVGTFSQNIVTGIVFIVVIGVNRWTNIHGGDADV